MPAASIQIRTATASDVPVILQFIRGLADYEQLPHLCVATEDRLRATLFGAQPSAEVLLAMHDDATAGFALFFSSYSTFLAQPGIYLEDLFVDPAFRGLGVGRALLSRLASIARARDCGRLEWSVLDWNRDAIGFYEKLGASGMTDWTVHRLDGSALDQLATEGERYDSK